MTQDRMTFSFRCPKTLKEAFAAKAKANGTTASALIKDFMQAYIDGSHDSSTDNNTGFEIQSTDAEQQSTDTQDNGVDNQQIKELKALIHQQQQEIDRIGNLAASKASRDEMTDYAEDILGRSFEEYSHQWQYHLEQEINHRLLSGFEFYGEGLSCPLPMMPEELPTNDNAPAGEVSESESADSSSSESSFKDSHSNQWELEPWTTKELAREYGISPQNLTNWRTGKTQPRGQNASLWQSLNNHFQYDPATKKWIQR